jgi:hypothetical protein
VKVYAEPGRYGGWPANHGIWRWGDEILVGFQTGYHKEQAGHTIDWTRPIRKVFARSRDGGETWTLEDTLPDALDNLVDRPGAPDTPHYRAAACPGGIDFSHPDFVMTFSHADFHVGPSRFWVSYDRGRVWAGPFRLPDMGTPGVAARTDYLLNGPHSCLLFLTAAKDDRREGRPFCARTTDGGKTWEFVAWIGPAPERGFAIMPSSMRLANGDLLVAVRACDEQTGVSAIIAYRSIDEGRTWQRATDPVPDLAPGSNPPALVRLRDGRLCVTYGVRHPPFRICARLSRDEGRTWGEEIVLRDDGANGDLGYTRTVQRDDGSVVTVYYFNDAASGPERYIGATLWRAED